MASKRPKPIALQEAAQAGCAELLEVTLFAPQGANDQDFLLGADVRFGTMNVSSEDWSKSVEIGLARATLSLDLDGCRIDPSANRFGDRKPSSSKTRIERTQTATANTRVGGKGSVGASVKGTMVLRGEAAATVSIGASKDSKTSATETQVADTREEPVVAMPGNRWRFSAVVEDYMQSRYSGDEALCKLEVTAPSIKVEGRLSFLPKDIVMIDVEAPAAFLDRFKKSPNQAAIAKVLLAKHLKQINQIPENGSVAPIVGWFSVLAGGVKKDD